MEAQVKKWLDNCLKHHTTCKETSTFTTRKYMPSRLLDLGRPGDAEVRLWIWQGPAERVSSHPYMTLSHRWDDHNSEDPEIRGRQHKLTWENIEKLRRGIRVNVLPNTWQDAIFVARSIGAQFLWIDSLCIIQENGPYKDFHQETGQMANIYGNSLCNITAIGAWTSKDGCMYQRHPNSVRPCRISLRRIDEQKEYYIIPTSLWEDEVDFRPLQDRGWVFQELMLAPRILHLSRRQIYWQCHQLKACEVFPGGIPRYVTSEEMPSLPKLIQDRESCSNIAAAQGAWKKILMTYTSLELSHSADKLNALLGVIKRLEVVFSDQCVAGLWSGYLPHQLLWRSSTNINRDIMTLLERPSYRVPTWSWASTDRRMKSGSFHDHDSGMYAEVIAISLNGRNIPLAGNYWVGISGEINSSVLRILAYLMTAELCITAFANGDKDIKLIINERPMSMTSEDMSIDVKEKFTGGHALSYELGGSEFSFKSRLKLFCLVIRAKNQPGRDTKGVECLPLRKAEPPSFGVFERYGYARISEYSVQGQLPVDWYSITNAEWFPPFVSQDQFGRHEIEII
jgi:hypothetical protein